MNEIILNWISFENKKKKLAEYIQQLKYINKGNRIDNANWKNYPYKPISRFWIGRTTGEIILHFEVIEDYVSARQIKTNSEVCKDSCVEFFISDGKKAYFNFEFNAIGTSYAGYGSDRWCSHPLPIDMVNMIRVKTSLGEKPFTSPAQGVKWSLSAGIPLEIFSGTLMENPSGKRFAANFFKCAEETRKPHFVSWNPVITAEPDFHRPEYFGKIFFN